MQPHQELEAACNDCSLTLKGDFQTLVLRGKENYARLEGRVETLRVEGQNNKVECLQMPARVVLRGRSQRVLVVERPGDRRPKTDVEGQDQGLSFTPKL